MSFLRQVKIEIANILRSKFLLIIGIIVLLASALLPVIEVLSPPSDENNYPGPIIYERAIAYDSKIGMPSPIEQEPITIDGEVITSDNPMYGYLSSLIYQRQAIEDNQWVFQNTSTSIIVLDMLDYQTDFYMHFARKLTKSTDYNDYRMEFVWNGMTSVITKYLYENSDKDPAALYEASQNFGGMYYENQEAFNKAYIDITSEERLAGIDKADEYLNKVYDMIDNDNFALYIDLKIEEQYNYIDQNNASIAIYEQNAKDFPEQEDEFYQQIKWLQEENARIEQTYIPILQYRLEKNIIPNVDIWQNAAIDELQQAQSFLVSFNLISAEDFDKPENEYLKQQYGTYQRYVAEMNAQKLEYQNVELIAKNSLDNEKPDMRYATDGVRSKTVKSLFFSVIAALFAVLVGGWIMGSEFQMGTIRLLLIRPKTRTKILMAKFLAALVLCLGVYLVGTVLNVVANGICFGFSDFAFPNYNVAGEVGFFGYYIPKMLACAVPIIFGFSIAFLMSVLVKNIAVSIAVPLICFVGCYLLMNSLVDTRMMDWIAYTPIPYVQLSDFFMPYNTMYTQFGTQIDPSNAIQLMLRGMPLSVTYGIILMLALSAICVIASIFTFRKRDITN